jgi:peptidoglycan/xylan/chitin deacetylase (PgdA/CDA1 family)
MHNMLILGYNKIIRLTIMLNQILLLICKLGDTLFAGFFKYQVPVFFYHSVGGLKKRINVSAEEFERQIKYLKEKGYRGIGLLDLLKPKNIEGAKKIIICFDDGFRNNLTTALPILNKYGFKACIFISTDFIGKQSEYVKEDKSENMPMLAEEDIRELAKNGWTIASHFHTHTNLVDLSDDEIIDEIKTSRQILATILNDQKPVDIFSYPRNKIDARVLSVVRNQDIKIAFAGRRRYFKEGDDMLNIPRIEIDKDVDFVRFKLYLSPTYFFIRNNIFKR